MEIINEIKRTMKFKDLPIGDTFVIGERRYLYMKTLPMKLCEETKINAIVLNDGSVTYFEEDAEVIVIECKITMLREGW